MTVTLFFHVSTFLLWPVAVQPAAHAPLLWTHSFIAVLCVKCPQQMGRIFPPYYASWSKTIAFSLSENISVRLLSARCLFSLFFFFYRKSRSMNHMQWHQSPWFVISLRSSTDGLFFLFVFFKLIFGNNGYISCALHCWCIVLLWWCTAELIVQFQSMVMYSVFFPWRVAFCFTSVTIHAKSWVSLHADTTCGDICNGSIVLRDNFLWHTHCGGLRVCHDQRHIGLELWTVIVWFTRLICFRLLVIQLCVLASYI